MPLAKVVTLYILSVPVVSTFAQANQTAIPQSGTGVRSVAPVIANKIPPQHEPIAYSTQQFDPNSCLGQRVAINFRQGLLKIFSVDDYLASYGKRPKWPTGEYLGKIMQGLSCMHLQTGNALARQRLDKVIDTWCRLQTDDGWLGTTSRFKSWDIWEHKYVLLGLLDYYTLTGDQRALDAARKIGDLYCATIGPGRGDINQSGHWAMGSASILEPMVYLYRTTGNPRYLQLCQYIVDSFDSPTGPGLIRTMTTGSKRVCDIEDPFANRAAREVKFKTTGQVRNRSKGYEMLSCVIGLARMYQLTGKPEYMTVAKNVWEDISANRLYLAGSAGADECFKDDHCLPAEATDGPAEGCVTAHWIYLCRVLFEITGDLRYIDALETSLYNYLLASQRPQDCHQSYNTPMNGRRRFQLHDVKGAAGKAPCCLTSVMREIARTPESIWTQFADGGLGILIYNAGSMEATVATDDGSQTVNAKIDSDYPRSGEVAIQIRPTRPATFRVALRVPVWSKQFTATVGNQTLTGNPGTFLDIRRRWEGDQTIQITMDLNTRLVSGGASYPGHFALQRGPQVLTLVAKHGSVANLTTARIRSTAGPELKPAPSDLPDGWIGSQAYTTDALVGAERCLLVPFADACQPGMVPDCRTWIAAEGHAGTKVPAAPSSLKATVLGSDRVQLVWSDQSDDELGFRIERKRRDVGMWFHVKTPPADSEQSEDGPTNVVLPGKHYSYRIAAYNETGLSPWSNETTVSLPTVAVPQPPTNLSITEVSPTQLKLTWTDNSDSEQGFRVECKTGSDHTWSVVAGRIPANLPAFTDYGLTRSQTYTYRVAACNTAGVSAWSNEASMTTADSFSVPVEREAERNVRE